MKELLEQLQQAFADFRKANDERIAALERGQGTAEITAKVDRANAQIVALEAKVEEERKKLRETETTLARIDLSPRDQQHKDREHAQQFFNMARAIRKENDADAEVSAEQVGQYQAYRKAFMRFCRRGPDALNDPDIRAALTVGTDPAGGYWVPPSVTGRTVQLLYELSPMRQLASVQSISTDRLIGYNDLDEASAGWVGETSSRPETGAGDAPGRYEIPVHEMYANPRASQTLLDDAAVDVEAWFAKRVANKLARVEAPAFVSGNGVAKARGSTTYANANAPTKANWQRIEYTKTGANGAFAGSNPADVFITCIGLMKEPLLAGAVFAMSRLTKAATRKIKDGQGNYLLLPDFRDGFKETLLGFPIVGMEDMPVFSTTGADAIAFGNFAEAYQVVDRQGIRVLRDPYTAKPYVQFYSTARVGGDVVNFEALKLIRFAA